MRPFINHSLLISQHLTPTSLLEFLLPKEVLFFTLMGENGDAEAITRQDLNQFRDFLLDQLKSHTSELSSKFNKAAFDAESALSVSKQVKAENDLKFNHPGNERNYKFNLEILELLEKLSKAIDAQETVKATQLLDSSVLLLKERNRKI